jgi:hypothetical protein
MKTANDMNKDRIIESHLRDEAIRNEEIKDYRNALIWVLNDIKTNSGLDKSDIEYIMENSGAKKLNV